MLDWTRKRNKRITGAACLLISLFLFAVPLLGMAAENTVFGSGPLPCFCEKHCTKESHNTQCPACAADMDLCAGKDLGELPAACSCADKCREDSVSQECALCRTDWAQCTGRQPEPPSQSEPSGETEKPTEAEKPTEPGKPAEDLLL